MTPLRHVQRHFGKLLRRLVGDWCARGNRRCEMYREESEDEYLSNSTVYENRQVRREAIFALAGRYHFGRGETEAWGIVLCRQWLGAVDSYCLHLSWNVACSGLSWHD